MVILALVTPILALGFLLLMQRFERWMLERDTQAADTVFSGGR